MSTLRFHSMGEEPYGLTYIAVEGIVQITDVIGKLGRRCGVASATSYEGVVGVWYATET